jgi:four helix bundle protein
LDELKYYIILSKDLSYITQNEYNNLGEKIDEIGRMLSGLINSIKNRS